MSEHFKRNWTSIPTQTLTCLKWNISNDLRRANWRIIVRWPTETMSKRENNKIFSVPIKFNCNQNLPMKAVLLSSLTKHSCLSFTTKSWIISKIFTFQWDLLVDHDVEEFPWFPLSMVHGSRIYVNDRWNVLTLRKEEKVSCLQQRCCEYNIWINFQHILFCNEHIHVGSYSFESPN